MPRAFRVHRRRHHAVAQRGLSLFLAGGICALPAARLAWGLEKRRFTILSVLLLTVSAIKVTEDVMNKESGPVDEAILAAACIGAFLPLAISIALDLRRA